MFSPKKARSLNEFLGDPSKKHLLYPFQQDDPDKYVGAITEYFAKQILGADYGTEKARKAMENETFKKEFLRNISERAKSIYYRCFYILDDGTIANRYFSVEFVDGKFRMFPDHVFISKKSNKGTRKTYMFEDGKYLGAISERLVYSYMQRYTYAMLLCNEPSADALEAYAQKRYQVDAITLGFESPEEVINQLLRKEILKREPSFSEDKVNETIHTFLHKNFNGMNIPLYAHKHYVVDENIYADRYVHITTNGSGKIRVISDEGFVTNLLKMEMSSVDGKTLDTQRCIDKARSFKTYNSIDENQGLNFVTMWFPECFGDYYR